MLKVYMLTAPLLLNSDADLDSDARWEAAFAHPNSEKVLAMLLAEAEEEEALGLVYDCEC